MAKKQTRSAFVVCVANDGCDALQVWKRYRVLPDANAEGEGYWRVVDESGEDYLYPAVRFVAVEFPAAVAKKLLAAGKFGGVRATRETHAFAAEVFEGVVSRGAAKACHPSGPASIYVIRRTFLRRTRECGHKRGSHDRGRSSARIPPEGAAMASKMLAEWKSAKQQFETVAERKAPKKTFLGIRYSGIEPALKKCDEIANERTGNNSATKLRTELAKLQQKVGEYINLLDDEIAKQPEKNTLYKALKALKAKAAEFEPHYDVFIKEHETAADPLDGLKTTAHPKVLKAIAHAVAAIKRVSANPTVAAYDAEFDTSGGSAGRTLVTALQAVQQTGGHPKYDAKAWMEKLTPWANPSGKHKVSLPTGTSREEVLETIKEFARLVKDLKSEAT
jgi:hypothetical protein